MSERVEEDLAGVDWDGAEPAGVRIDIAQAVAVASSYGARVE